MLKKEKHIIDNDIDELKNFVVVSVDAYMFGLTTVTGILNMHDLLGSSKSMALMCVKLNVPSSSSLARMRM